MSSVWPMLGGMSRGFASQVPLPDLPEALHGTCTWKNLLQGNSITGPLIWGLQTFHHAMKRDEAGEHLAAGSGVLGEE